MAEEDHTEQEAVDDDGRLQAVLQMLTDEIRQ